MDKVKGKVCFKMAASAKVCKVYSISLMTRSFQFNVTEISQQIKACHSPCPLFSTCYKQEAGSILIRGYGGLADFEIRNEFYSNMKYPETIIIINSYDMKNLIDSYLLIISNSVVNTSESVILYIFLKTCIVGKWKRRILVIY